MVAGSRHQLRILVQKELPGVWDFTLLPSSSSTGSHCGLLDRYWVGLAPAVTPQRHTGRQISMLYCMSSLTPNTTSSRECLKFISMHLRRIASRKTCTPPPPVLSVCVLLFLLKSGKIHPFFCCCLFPPQASILEKWRKSSQGKILEHRFSLDNFKLLNCFSIFVWFDFDYFAPLFGFADSTSCFVSLPKAYRLHYFFLFITQNSVLHYLDFLHVQHIRDCL